MSIDKLKEMGFNIIPLKPKSKEPIGGLNWKRYQEEKYTNDIPDSLNKGVVCGKTSGNLYVVDLDDSSLYDDFPEDMKDTFTTRTGKGFHMYFNYPSDEQPPNLKLDDDRGRHIDIKSQGGYVLAPTSVHPNGSIYTAINELPLKTVSGDRMAEVLISIGFTPKKKSIEEIEQGVSEGGRNDSTFKYACSMIRDRGLYGQALRLQVEELNKRHTPPLSSSELDIIISQAEKAEHRNMTKHVEDARSVIQQLSGMAQHVEMQDITPQFEGKNIEFDCMIIAVGERMTYTQSGTFECKLCHARKDSHADNMHHIPIPLCMCNKKHPREMDIDETTKVTSYIQQLRIQEFMETAKNGSPVAFDAEIVDESVGEAYIGDRKTVIAKFRSVPKPKSAYNQIIFKISSMKDLEQKEGCLPSPEELEKWKTMNIFDRVVESIAPEIYIDPKIVQSLVIWSCGGTSLNGKRDLIHMAIFGDAQLGKSELLSKMHKLLVGSGYTTGTNVSGVGLTIAMVKSYNGTLIPEAGFFPQHHLHPCIFDEIDKMNPKDQDVCYDVMESGTTTNTKAGTHGGLTLPTKCPLLVAGNPKNGKFNPNYPTIMDNFEMKPPFVSRFDILWLLVDQNDPDTDDKIMDHINSYESRKDTYMKIDEMQRYFEYIKGLTAVVPKSLEPKLRALYKKMRPLNIDSSVPVGIRQYHGLYRLVTACAKAHLRTEATEEDFDIIESIINASYNSMKMNLKDGTIQQQLTAPKKGDQALIVWGEVMDKETQTVDKDDFIKGMISKGFIQRKAEEEFEKISKIYDNDLERWKKTG